jgi:hypothetical protein
VEIRLDPLNLSEDHQMESVLHELRTKLLEALLNPRFMSLGTVALQILDLFQEDLSEFRISIKHMSCRKMDALPGFPRRASQRNPTWLSGRVGISNKKDPYPKMRSEVGVIIHSTVGGGSRQTPLPAYRHLNKTPHFCQPDSWAKGHGTSPDCPVPENESAHPPDPCIFCKQRNPFTLTSERANQRSTAKLHGFIFDLQALFLYNCFLKRAVSRHAKEQLTAWEA